MSMYEIDEAAKAITEAAHPDANTICGAIVDEAMSGEIKITVIATGFDSDEQREPRRPQIPTSSQSKTPLRANESGSSLNLNLTAEDEDEPDSDRDLDVPAFIRRKLK